MTNIKELKEVITFGLSVAKVVRADLADGKMSLMEIFGLLKLIGPAQDAFEGIGSIPAEIKDLDSSESTELCELVRQALEQDISDDMALVKANQALSAVQSFLSSIAMFRGINPPS